MTPLELFLALSWVPWFIIAMLQQRRIKRLQKQLANRPIGRIVSSEVTKEGLMMTGEIWDDKVWDQIAGDVKGMSIGPIKAEPVMPTKKKGYW